MADQKRESAEACVRRVAFGMAPCDFGSAQAIRAMASAITDRDRSTRAEALEEVRIAMLRLADDLPRDLDYVLKHAVTADKRLADVEPDDG